MEEQKKLNYKRVVLELVRLAVLKTCYDYYKELPYMTTQEEEKARRKALCKQIEDYIYSCSINYREIKKDFLRKYEKVYTEKDIEDIEHIIDKYKREG